MKEKLLKLASEIRLYGSTKGQIIRYIERLKALTADKTTHQRLEEIEFVMSLGRTSKEEKDSIAYEIFGTAHRLAEAEEEKPVIEEPTIPAPTKKELIEDIKTLQFIIEDSNNLTMRDAQFMAEQILESIKKMR